MKAVKIIAIPVILALIVYGVFIMFKRSNKLHSPLPDDGIKVIQITPAK